MSRRWVGRVAAAMSVTVLLGSCAPTPESCRLNQTATGALVGAGVGAALGGIGAALGGARAGTGLAIAAGGALVGGVIGASIGNHNDMVCHQMAIRQALDAAVAQNMAYQQQLAERQAALAQARNAPPPGSTSAPQVARKPPPPPPPAEYQTVAWADKMTNNSGTITPLSNATAPAGAQQCMTFSDTQTINGQSKVVVGKACKGSDGDWHPVN
jgi:surface antigen